MNTYQIMSGKEPEKTITYTVYANTDQDAVDWVGFVYRAIEAGEVTVTRTTQVTVNL